MVTVNIQSDNGQIISPSTGGECGSGRMVSVAVLMMVALVGAVTTAYSRKKRTIR